MQKRKEVKRKKRQTEKREKREKKTSDGRLFTLRIKKYIAVYGYYR